MYNIKKSFNFFIEKCFKKKKLCKSPFKNDYKDLDLL